MCVFAVTFLAASCRQNESNKNNHPVDSKTSNAVEYMENPVTGVEKMDFSDSIQLKVNENMLFDKELFRVKVGNKIRLVLKNTSAKSTMSMVHNVVILNKIESKQFDYEEFLNNVLLGSS